MVRFFHLSLAVIASNLLCSCASTPEKPLVEGMFEPGGTIYRETEQEDFGPRSTVKVHALDF